jgi:hypothetical protein
MEKTAKTGATSHLGDLGPAWIGIGAGMGLALGAAFHQLVWGMLAGAAIGTVLFAILASWKGDPPDA